MGERRRRSAQGPIGFMRPPGPPSQMPEKSCVRVKWGDVQYRTVKSNLNGWCP